MSYRRNRPINRYPPTVDDGRYYPYNPHYEHPCRNYRKYRSDMISTYSHENTSSNNTVDYASLINSLKQLEPHVQKIKADEERAEIEQMNMIIADLNMPKYAVIDALFRKLTLLTKP